LEHETLSVRNKLCIRPTASGWILLFLLVWVPFAAIFTGNNFLFIIFGMMVGLGLVSHLLAKRNVNSVDFSRRFPDDIFAGAPFAIDYFVRTRGTRASAFSIALDEQSPLERLGKQVEGLSVPPRGTTRLSGLFAIGSRGDKDVEPAVLSSTFPFGLAVYTRQCGSTGSLIVFPRIEPVHTDVPFAPRESGRTLERIDPFGTVPYHFRDYVAGDLYKHIDWKKSARSGRFITRILSDEAGSREVNIRLAGDASEQAISRAASLVVHFAQSATPVSLEGHDFASESGTGPEHTRTLLTILARWENPRGGYSRPSHHPGIIVQVDGSGAFHWSREGAAIERTG